MRQMATQHVVGMDAAHGKAPAMKVQQHRQLVLGVGSRCRTGRHIQPGGHHLAVAGGYRAFVYPLHGVWRHVEHARACFIKSARLLRVHGVHGQLRGAVNAVNHAPHGGGQQALRMGMVRHAGDSTAKGAVIAF